MPVVIGAPNIKFYAPDAGPYPYESASVIYSGDYADSPERLARLMLSLEAHEPVLERMIDWKRTGFSDDFKAVAHMTSVTWMCRMCILVADDRRNTFGANVFDLKRVVSVAVDAAPRTLSVVVVVVVVLLVHRLIRGC